jgi:hypothetical protein
MGRKRIKALEPDLDDDEEDEEEFDEEKAKQVYSKQDYVPPDLNDLVSTFMVLSLVLIF